VNNEDGQDDGRRGKRGKWRPLRVREARLYSSAAKPGPIYLSEGVPCGPVVCRGCVVKIEDPTSETGLSHLHSSYEGLAFQAKEILWE
jgi:hypothetical protein